MVRVAPKLQALKYDALRSYAQWRLGVRREEAYTYNTTDRILLTFDDFGTAETIRGMLRVLKRENVKAYFFFTGEWADQHPNLLQEVAAAGHWIGNHTYSHPHLNRLSDDEIRSQISKGPKGTLMRPPYGDYNQKVRSIAAELGYKISFWTIDSWDWHKLSAAEMLNIILPRLHKGACILMHMNAPHTLEMLPGLIAGIKAQGYELCHDGTEIKV